MEEFKTVVTAASSFLASIFIPGQQAIKKMKILYGISGEGMGYATRS